jgi:hypothetical protein
MQLRGRQRRQSPRNRDAFLVKFKQEKPEFAAHNVHFEFRSKDESNQRRVFEVAIRDHVSVGTAQRSCAFKVGGINFHVDQNNRVNPRMPEYMRGEVAVHDVPLNVILEAIAAASSTEMVPHV